MEMVTISMGQRNAVGDWIVTEHFETKILAETSNRQIVVTACVDGLHEGYDLTHVQSGFFLLGGFSSIGDAVLGAERLSQLFPVETWDWIGSIGDVYRRDRVHKRYQQLSADDKRWMAQHGGPRA